MLKLVDKPDLGSGAERRMGSIPFARTKRALILNWLKVKELGLFYFIEVQERYKNFVKFPYGVQYKDKVMISVYP